MAWHTGEIYEAWGEIHRALHEAMTPLPAQTLAFLAERASDRIIRDKAAEVLDRLDSLDGEDKDGLSRADALRRLFRKETRGVGQPENGGGQPSGLEQAAAFAEENDELAIWDRAARPWAIALYDARRKELHPLADEEAATLLNHDSLTAREWLKWNAMTGNRGSLIVLDSERVQRVLSDANEEDLKDGGPPDA